MTEKERKQLMLVIPLLAVAAFMVFWFVIRPQMGTPSPPPQETTSGQPTPMPAYGGTVMPTEDVAVVADTGEHGPSQEAARGDPFVSYTTVHVIEPPPPPPWGRRPRPTIPPVISLPEPEIIVVAGDEEQHERRMAGMLHNGRVYAIYERDGVGLVVKPGDPVQDEIVVAITKDHMILRSLDGRERKVPLERMPGYEATGPGGYEPGVYRPRPGAPRPPSRPPTGMM